MPCSVWTKRSRCLRARLELSHIMKGSSPSNLAPPLNKVFDLMLDAVCVVDASGHFVFVSAACERIFGYQPDEMIGQPMINFVFPADRARTLQAADKIVQGLPSTLFENRYVRKDGEVVDIMWSAQWSQADQVRVAIARDVTERKQADSMQAALYTISEAAHAAEDLPALFQKIHQIINNLLPAENFLVALYDEHKDALSFPYYVDEETHQNSTLKTNSSLISAEIIRTGNILHLSPATPSFPAGYVRTDGAHDTFNLIGMPLHANKGVIGALILKSYKPEICYTQRDIDLLQFVSAQIAMVIERKQMELWLQHIARHDPLTDLPNRALFNDRLQTALLMAKRNQARFALLYIDLDKFKQVNDTLGHAAGDLLLQEAAQRLRRCVRESDTVGRVGGDEFLVLLNNTALAGALQVAENIRLALGRTFEVGGHPLSMLPSIGVALYPEHGDGYKQLIHCADEAMYRAKKQGGNQTKLGSDARTPEE